MLKEALLHRGHQMEHVIKLWETGLQGVMALLSEQRFSEVQVAFEMMEAVWPGEKKIRGLKKKMKHW